MTKHIYRDPKTGRFTSHPDSIQLAKRKAEEHFLALTIIYVVCFCTIALIIAITMLFVQFQMLKNLATQNSTQIRELTRQLHKEEVVVVPVEVLEPEPVAEPLPELVPDEEKPRPLVRVFRGSKVTEE